MVFYNPFTMELGNIPTIVYPAKGVDEVFSKHDKGCVERYLQGIWNLHNGLVNPDTEYMIGMVWNDDANKMLDLWTHRNSKGYGFGPLIDVKLFRNFSQYIPDQNKQGVDEGSASGNTLVLLAAEENCRVAAGNLQKYLTGKRPELPDRMRLGEDFYLVGE